MASKALAFSSEWRVPNLTNASCGEPASVVLRLAEHMGCWQQESRPIFGGGNEGALKALSEHYLTLSYQYKSPSSVCFPNSHGYLCTRVSKDAGDDMIV